MLKGDTSTAVSFLRSFAPDGPWCLTSIDPDKRSLETVTFTSIDEVENMTRWIDFGNGHKNLYFHVNPVLGKLTKKADREKIAAVTYLHVDIDPKKGVDLEGEQQRILGLLTTGLKRFKLPVPTFVTFSGGGYQAFWKLETPIEINGNVDLAEDAKLYNKQLELLFGGDSCHNIDRVMRLPGTVNLPDAKKRAAGRVPVLARVVQDNLDAGAVYPLMMFTKAVLTSSDLKAHEDGLQISGNVSRILNVDELKQWNVPDTIQIIIAQGKDPDRPKQGDNSRSAWLWHALCEMARCDVPAEVMYAIITDPEWPISASILDKGRLAEAEARRQIARAIQFAVNPALLQMNSDHFCAIIGGKFRIATRTLDPITQRESWVPWEKGTFKDFYETEEVEVAKTKDGKPIMENKAKWWLSLPQRRQYKGVIFAPAASIETSGYFNSWQGFQVDAKPGGDCSLFLEHCRDVLCSGREDLYQYLLGWMARMVQEPGKPGEVAIVLRGDRGAGKSFFATVLGSLFGTHYMAVSNSAHLVGNFNSHLRDIVFLFADEAFFAGDKRHESVLKTIITEPRLVIERKGVDVETSANCIHLVMASNDFHVIPVGRKERRFLVLEASRKRVQDFDWFNRISAQLDDGGREALLHFLLTYDLSNFNVRSVPQTDELNQQMKLGHSHQEAWWKRQLEEGSLGGIGEWPDAIPRQIIFDHYYASCQQQKVSRPLSNVSLGVWLNDICPGLGETRKNQVVKVYTPEGFEVEKVLPRQYHYCFPSLADCRRAWCDKYGPEKWPDS